MNSDEFDALSYEDQTHLAERELAAFIGAVNELFGPEEALLSADSWLDDSESMDSPPRSTGRDWRAVTVAASARLAHRLAVVSDRRALAAATNTEAPRIASLPSFTCFRSALVA